MTTKTDEKQSAPDVEAAAPDVEAAAPDVEAAAPPTNVVAAISRVMAELPAIGKDQHASQQQGGYAYRGIEQITSHASGLFAKYGVVFVPRVLSDSVEVVDIEVNSRPWTDTRVLVEYDVYGPGGVDDKITVGPILAIGRDNSDKGANKCMTQAFKYALLQVLCISDDADDADRGSQEADARTPPRGRGSGNANDTPMEPPEGRRTSANNTRRGPRVLEGWADIAEQREAHDAFLALSKTLDERQTADLQAWRDERGDYEWPMPKAVFVEYAKRLREVAGPDAQPVATEACPSCGAALSDENVYDTERKSCGECAVL